jgi:hypothetical protein
VTRSPRARPGCSPIPADHPGNPATPGRPGVDPNPPTARAQFGRVGKRKAYDTPDSPMVDIVEELIPARYNANSELKVTVKKGGQKETFALASK